MLNNRTANFAELVWSAAAKVDNNAPAITDKIMKRAFPQTCAEARIEGADKMLRVGVIADVKRILKHGSIDETQIDFSELGPEFLTIAQKSRAKPTLSNRRTNTSRSQPDRRTGAARRRPETHAAQG